MKLWFFQCQLAKLKVDNLCGFFYFFFLMGSKIQSLGAALRSQERNIMEAVRKAGGIPREKYEN